MRPLHFALFLAVTGFAVEAQGLTYRRVLIENVPHLRQKPDFCGEACAAMFLRKMGLEMDQDDVFDQSGLDPSHGRGCYTGELKRALERIGFRVGRVWSKVQVSRINAEMEREWAALHGDLLKGIPSIVCSRYDDRPDTTEHFRLILGYDSARNEVIYHEPAEDNGAYRRMKRELFLKLWPLKYEKNSWSVIRLRLEAGKIQVPPSPRGFTGADYAQHILALRKKMPPPFTLVLERPFVVVGDGPTVEVHYFARRTVRWAVELLKKDFFEKDPNEIIDIWLFWGSESYKKHAREIFGDSPSTPYGYYSETHNALIMNIETGGGTLVHEIVHPFIRANFPNCPAWFNEGLASLYEQSSERKGKILGLTNWRLKGLKEAIRRGNTVPFEKLLSTSTNQFYNDSRGVHYAQARYLCYYLQEKGLLRKFYREFRAGWKEDPTGSKSLKKVLGKGDLRAFKKHWEDFVLKLKF